VPAVKESMLIFERVHAYSNEDPKTENGPQTENPPLLYMIRRDSVMLRKRLACCAACVFQNKETR
jgi:hypothetical protein